MSEQVTIMIDGKTITAKKGITIHKAAQEVGIVIPTICYHEFCTANGLCRICVVEVEGSRVLVPSCVFPITEGMKIQTKTKRICLARRSILEMLAASVDLSEAPDILQLMAEYQAKPDRFPEAEVRHPDLLDDNPLYIRDYAKCILCWRCVQVCAFDAQYTYAINFKGRGYDTQISTFYEIPLQDSTCVFCGQCIGVCPTGALKTKRQWLLEQGFSPQEIIEMTPSDRRSKNRIPAVAGVSK
jgi:NADH dehydrogenase/NADH:ubiquinone oxidoreductase subunit G